MLRRLLPLLAATCGAERILPECASSTLGVDFDGAVPRVSLDLRADGVDDPEIRVAFDRVAEGPASPRAACTDGFESTRLWEVRGRFSEVSYLEVPADAQVSFDAGAGPDGTDLVEGDLYVVSGAVFDLEGLTSRSCPGWVRVWRQGEPDSVVSCGP